MAIELYQRPQRVSFGQKLTSFDLTLPSSSNLFIDYGYADQGPLDQTRLEINYSDDQGIQTFIAVDANPRAVRIFQDGFRQIIYDRVERNFLFQDNFLRLTPDNQTDLNNQDPLTQFQFRSKGEIKLISSSLPEDEPPTCIELNPQNGEYVYRFNEDMARIYVNEDNDINYRYSSSSLVIAGNRQETLIAFPELGREMLIERSGTGFQGLVLSPKGVALDILQVYPKSLLEYYNYQGEESYFESLCIDWEANSHRSAIRKQQGRVWGYENGKYQFKEDIQGDENSTIKGEMDLINGSMTAEVGSYGDKFSLSSMIYSQIP